MDPAVPDNPGDHAEEAVDLGEREGTYPREPRAAFARTIDSTQWRPLALVLGVALVGVLCAFLSFRLGAAVLAIALWMALFMRFLLTDNAAGILAVRRRAIDLSVLAFLGLALSVLAVVVPPPA